MFALAVEAREDLADLQEQVAPGVLLLADPEGAAVSAFGMLDKKPFPPGRMLARAGTVLLDAKGRVLRWWLPENYREAPDPAAIVDAIP